MSNSTYEVEKILKKKYISGIPYYKIKWLGYSLKEATWEPSRNLKSISWMIKKFEEQAEELEKTALELINNASYDDLGGVYFNKSRRNGLRYTKNDFTPSLTFDVPNKIIKVVREKKGLKACIQWEPRADGVILRPSWHYTKDLKNHEQISSMLFDYYEFYFK